ncbi:retinol dehydrogenase 13-like [Oratosquilla oratoria]|uniref:retinol dehydrogenase 13-like n=1 Tax=Oratosquilla oratoria TaxID=337810 RepID=UPI003F75A4B2
MAVVLTALLYVAGVLVGLFGLFVMTSKLVIRWRLGMCTSKASMKGKVVIITGASAGIGKEAARDLARRGARVIMACRNLPKANKVAEEIRKSTGSDLVEVQLLDTSSMASVRKFANNFLKNETRLDVLILNAGIVAPATLTYTEDDHELTMATNHLGHFLLTNILLDLVKRSSPSRIVVVSSINHRYAIGLDPDDLNNKKRPYLGSYQSYNHTKLCNVLFTKQLSHYLEGTDVACNVLGPGLTKTEIFAKLPGRRWMHLLGTIAHFGGKSNAEGAQTTIHLAVAEEEANTKGEYFENCKVSYSTAEGNDMGLAKKLWEKSEELVDLRPEERHY